MKKVYDIFKQIETTSGKNDKIQIIKDNADNEEFVEFLKFLYDDMITTGLSSKKINKEFNLDDFNYVDVFFNDVLEVMSYLETNNTGTDKVIMEVQCFLGSIEWTEYQEWLKQVFTKSYKCGITASSVNKAIPNCIKEFKVQLAHPYEKYEDKIKGDFTITKKLDGHRTLAFVEVDENGVASVKFRTRKGHEIHGLVEIEEAIVKGFFGITDSPEIVLDGEITILNDNSKNVFQETSKIIRKDGEKTGLKFHVFDYVYSDVFFEGSGQHKNSLPYRERRKIIERMFSYYRFSDSKFVVKVPVLYSGADKTQILSWSEKATEMGWEGVMVNINDAPYVTKRTPDLLKVKKFHSADIKCVGVFRGEGKYENTLGGIYVDFKGTKVGVGTGFTDEQRDYYWNNQDEIIGEIVEIKYFEESTNQKDDSISLRFPVFVTKRPEKCIQDINYD